MCAQFMIKAKFAVWARINKIRLPEGIDEHGDDIRIMPYQRGPAIRLDGTELRVDMMQFSLLPSWSKEKRVKFATHNARLDGIAEKPTWKKPLASQRCLIPMTDFFEPTYVREHAGHMVGFRTQGEEVMVAAGLWDEWHGKDGEVIESFAVITDDPIQFVREIGHDRSPLFLAPKAFEEWLDPATKDPVSLVKFLQQNRADPKLEVFRDREMKAGWEKRIPKA